MIEGTHQGKSVTVEYKDSVVQELRDRAQRIVEKINGKSERTRATMLPKYQVALDNWNTIDSAEKLQASPDCCQEYINFVLYDEGEFNRVFA